MSILEVRDLVVAIDGLTILNHISLSIPAGRITAILGPNGSGKSTLLKAMSRVLTPKAGTVLLGGRNLSSLGSRELARRLAVLPQAPQAPPDLTVRDLVEHGRFPHRSWWRGFSASDQPVVDWALEQTGMLCMADRLVSTLSGGERQRTWIAMALAQQPEILLLDEPTTYLDICHQLEIMQLSVKLNTRHGITVVMVLHDINQAAQYADYIAVLHAGAVFAAGKPEQVVNSGMLREVFKVEADVLPAGGGRPVFVVTGLAGRKDENIR